MEEPEGNLWFQVLLGRRGFRPPASTWQLFRSPQPQGGGRLGKPGNYHGVRRHPGPYLDLRAHGSGAQPAKTGKI